MSVPGWVLQTKLGRYKTEKEREKLRIGLVRREWGAGYEKNNCGELRIRLRGLLHWEMGIRT